MKAILVSSAILIFINLLVDLCFDFALGRLGVLAFMSKLKKGEIV